MEYPLAAGTYDHTPPLSLRTCTHLRQANVWMAIFGFIGNYFWTHYFFNLLGAAYTLPSHRLNGVSACASGQPAMH
jgi:cycloeucalenol cycloisomerase